MSNKWVVILEDLVKRIDEVEQPDPVWDVIPEDFEFKRSNLEDFKTQILYNILHYSAWPEAKTRINNFVKTIKYISAQNVINYRVESDIEDCYQTFKAYIDALSNRMHQAEVSVTEYFALIPGHDRVVAQARVIAESCVRPLSEIMEKMSAAEASEKIGSILSIALLKANISGLDKKEIGSIVKKVQQMMESVEKEKRVSKEEESLTKKSQAQELILKALNLHIRKNAQTIAMTIRDQVIPNEEKPEVKFWGNANKDIERLMTGFEKKPGFEAVIDQFSESMRRKIKPKIDEYLKDGAAKLDNVEDWVPYVGMLSDIESEQKKVKKMFFIELLWWSCIVILLGGIGCLAYYAYELHIKPLHLGISLALMGISIMGLFVKNNYQQFHVKDAFPKPTPIKLDTVYVDPNLKPPMDRPQDLIEEHLGTDEPRYI